MNNNKFIELKDVSFRYNKDSAFILEHFSYCFEFNKIYGIVGLNGSGKTTLIKLLANLLLPSQGSINYWNQYLITFNKKTRKLFPFINQDVGVLFQFATNQLFASNVLEEATYGLKNHHVNTKDSEELALKWLKYFDFDADLLDSDVFSLSFGQQKKLLLASLFALNQKVLILDEPTLSLDNFTKIQLINYLKQQTQDKLIIIVSHDLDFLYDVCDELLLIHENKLAYANHKYTFFYDELVNNVLINKPFIVQVISDLMLKSSKYARLKNQKINNLEELKQSILEVQK